MATVSETNAVRQADYAYSSDSESSDSASETQTFPETTNQVSGIARPHDKSLPVFDLRRRQFTKPVFQKFSLISISREEVQQKVAEENQAQSDQVRVLESRGRVEETLVQTWIIILPDYETPLTKILLIEAFESLDQTHAVLWCTRVNKSFTVKAVNDLILKELQWKSASLCMNSRVLDPEMKIANVSAEEICKMQVMKSQNRNVCMVFQPKPNVNYSYSLEADVTISVRRLKALFLKEFKDDMLIRDIGSDQVIHIFYHDLFLEDSTCIGLVLRGSKDETFLIHIAVQQAVCVTFKYKIHRGKTRVPYFQQTSIKANCSTSDLRTEAAKYLNIDPKAVKLTIANKRLEEKDNLEGVLVKGTLISVGVKKKKTVQLHHPVTRQECAVDLYMLETVHVLKTEVAQAFGVDPLHVSLQCRGSEMRDKDILVNYPIKNKMELGMELYQNRIVVMVVIIFKKKRVRLVIDDIDKSTVDDLLMYCACKFQYSRRHSRAIYQQQCLYKYHTMREAGMQSGSTVHIVYFENSEEQMGNLMRVYTVMPDGQINPRWGSVCDGVLLHASKKLMMTREQSEETLNNGGSPPVGIHLDLDGPQLLKHSGNTGANHSQDMSRNVRMADEGDTAKFRKINKARFLRKAQAVFQRRFDLDQTYRKELQLESNMSSLESTGMAESLDSLGQVESDEADATLSSRRTLNKRNSKVKFFLAESSAENLTDSSLFNTSTPHCSKQQQSTSIKRRQLNRELDNRANTEEENGELSQQNLDKDQPISRAIPQKIPIQTEAKIFFKRKKDLCSEFGQNMREIQDLQTYTGDISMSAADSTSDVNESSSSHNQSTETTYERNLQRFEQTHSGGTHCPYLQFCHFRRHIGCGPPAEAQRRRCHTVGEAEVTEELALINASYTCPVLPTYQKEPNEELNTSGITVSLLNFVSSQVGKSWKQLARQLKVDEKILEMIEYEQKGLHETSFQTLLAWKRCRGMKGTRVELLEALKNAGMQSLVDMCEKKLATLCYQTA